MILAKKRTLERTCRSVGIICHIPLTDRCPLAVVEVDVVHQLEVFARVGGTAVGGGGKIGKLRTGVDAVGVGRGTGAAAKGGGNRAVPHIGRHGSRTAARAGTADEVVTEGGCKLLAATGTGLRGITVSRRTRGMPEGGGQHIAAGGADLRILAVSRRTGDVGAKLKIDSRRKAGIIFALGGSTGGKSA